MVCAFILSSRLIFFVKDKLFPALPLSLQENSHATDRYCSISVVKVEEVTGNVLMTFCDCDDGAANGLRL